MKIDAKQLFNVNQVVEMFFPGRSTRWVRDTFCKGSYGYVARDRGGWLISGEAIEHWQKTHAVGVVSISVRSSQVANLRHPSGGPTT